MNDVWYMKVDIWKTGKTWDLLTGRKVQNRKPNRPIPEHTWLSRGYAVLGRNISSCEVKAQNLLVRRTLQKIAFFEC